MEIKNIGNSIGQIKKILLKLPSQEVKEVKDFVEFIYSKILQHNEKKNIERLEGIWKGLGFERLEIEKEISNIRNETNKTILQKSQEWNI